MEKKSICGISATRGIKTTPLAAEIVKVAADKIKKLKLRNPPSIRAPKSWIEKNGIRKDKTHRDFIERFEKGAK